MRVEPLGVDHHHLLALVIHAIHWLTPYQALALIMYLYRRLNLSRSIDDNKNPVQSHSC